MSIGTPDYDFPDYRFHFYVDDGDGHTAPLDLSARLFEEPPGGGGWSLAQKDAIAQAILDAVTGIEFITGGSAFRSRAETTEITPTP